MKPPVCVDSRLLHGSSCLRPGTACPKGWLRCRLPTPMIEVAMERFNMIRRVCTVIIRAAQRQHVQELGMYPDTSRPLRLYSVQGREKQAKGDDYIFQRRMMAVMEAK